MKKPAVYCKEQAALPAAAPPAPVNGSAALAPAGLSGGSTGFDMSQCRDDTKCTWDCFATSLVTTQCGLDANGQESYAKSGQLCASVNNVQAACANSDCMSPDAKGGFYRLTVDINCFRDDGKLTGPCKRSSTKAGGVDWKRVEEAERAMGTNTIPGPDGVQLPRCPRERWEPLTDPDKYATLVGMQVATECYDIVSCFPQVACKAANECGEGYEYTKYKCLQKMDQINALVGGNNAATPVNCTTDDDCRTMDSTGKIRTLAFREGQSVPTQPQAQSRCNARGRCECFDSPRCSMCTVGNRNPIKPSWNESLVMEEGGFKNPYFTKGYYRLNNKCEQCPDQPGLIVALFFIGIIALCIGGWVLNKKSFNVAFISIGVDYFQVLALFARSEISWPPLMRAFFEWCVMRGRVGVVVVVVVMMVVVVVVVMVAAVVVVVWAVVHV